MSEFLIEREFIYKGFQCCIILQSAGWRCGYVNVKYTTLKYVDYSDIGFIDVHGGLTYASTHLAGHDEHDDWWIGWDYAHTGDGIDATALYEKLGIVIDRWLDGHIYTEQEIEDDCKSVVDQILNHYGIQL